MSKAKSPKSKVTTIDINDVAKLGNLTLAANEKKLLEKQLQNVLGYISKLSEVNTNKLEPIGHITGLSNITRDDVPAPSLNQKDAIRNAPRIYNGFFEVEAIFDE